MELYLDLLTLKQLLQDAAELGGMKALTGAGVLKPYLSQSEAGRIYGRANVERWIKERLIIPIKDGPASAKVRLDRVKLEAIAKSSNRPFYLNSIERK